MKPTPDFIVLDESRHSWPPLSPAALTAACLEEMAWQQFSGSWQRASEHNRQLVLGLSLHSKSTFGYNLFFSQQMQELYALQAEFASQREALTAAMRSHLQQQGTRGQQLRQLGF